MGVTRIEWGEGQKGLKKKEKGRDDDDDIDGV